MKRYLVILFVFLSIHDLDAQEYFFNYVGGWKNYYSIELDSGYLLIGSKTRTGFLPGYYNKVFVNTIMLEGNVIDSMGYHIDSTAAATQFRDLVKLDDENYIACGAVVVIEDQQLDGVGVLVNYNTLSNEFTLLHENNNLELGTIESQYYEIEHPNDSTLLLAERWARLGPEINILYNMDMFGNERWHRDFYEGCVYCHMEPRQILSLSNGNIAYMYDFWTEENLPAYHERSKAVIRIVDGETGEEIGEPIYPGDEENYRIWAGGMVELDNGELMVSYTDRYYYDESGEWHYNPEATVHLDYYNELGELVLENNYLNDIPNAINDQGRYAYRVTQMQKLADGNILISGTTGNGGLLMKITPEGDLLWNREHFPHEYEENANTVFWYTRIYHVLPTSDGGFMCTGEYLSYPGALYPQGIQTAFALKVDEYGCLEEGCQVGIFEQSIEPIKLNVYPNPSTGIFHIELPKENEIYNLTVYNMVGERIRQESAVRGDEYLLDMSGMASGIYLLQLMGADGLVYVERIGVEY